MHNLSPTNQPARRLLPPPPGSLQMHLETEIIYHKIITLAVSSHTINYLETHTCFSSSSMVWDGSSKAKEEEGETLKVFAANSLLTYRKH